MIRKCSKKEFLKFLRHESVVSRIDRYPDKIRVKNIYVVEKGDKRLYFFYIETDVKKEVEAHVGAIKEHRQYARIMIKEILEWLKNKGYNSVITCIPDCFVSARNMTKKLGFEEVGVFFDEGYGCSSTTLKRVI